MKHYLLPEDLRNDVLSYLMGRPYMETAKGIQRLEALAVAPEVQSASPGEADPSSNSARVLEGEWAAAKICDATLAQMRSAPAAKVAEADPVASLGRVCRHGVPPARVCDICDAKTPWQEPAPAAKVK